MKGKAIVFIAIAVVLVGILISSAVVSAFVRSPQVATNNANSTQNLARIDDATDTILSQCSKTLPQGTKECDAGIQTVKQYCDVYRSNPTKYALPQSCNDP